MKSGREMVEIFGRCSRLLNKIVLNVEDGFFSRLCIKESDKLLSAFIFFLRCEGGEREHRIAQNDILQHGNVAQTGILQRQDVVKSDDIVQHEHRVAQCRLRLISRIKNILNLLDILKHLGLAKLSTSLLLEKDLLLLELLVLDISKPAAVSSGKTGKPVALRPEKKLRPSPHLNQAHKEILGFVNSKERVQNLEVFSQFAHVSRRTMKRKLSELIKTNSIKRFTEGRKVFYSASAEN